MRGVWEPRPFQDLASAGLVRARSVTLVLSIVASRPLHSSFEGLAQRLGSTPKQMFAAAGRRLGSSSKC